MPPTDFWTMAGVNMVVLDSNLRHYKKPDQPAYEKPGFETAHAPFQLKSHYLHDLLAREMGQSAAWAVDAQPRIALPADSKLLPSRRWTDLEHARMHDSLLPKPSVHEDAAVLQIVNLSTFGV